MFKKSSLALLSLLLMTGCAASNEASSAKNTPQTSTLQTTQTSTAKQTDLTASHQGLSAQDDYKKKVAASLAFAGSKEAGFDVNTYLDSEMGQWVMEQFRPIFTDGYDQTSAENLAHWKELGMEKTYHEGDNEVKEWSVFVPESYDENKAYPLMFVFHMGGSNILMAENMGYVENGAKNEYIVSCVSWAKENLTPEQETAFENSGIKHYESYVFKTIYGRLLEEYNIDPSRVYAAGFSGGGNATAYAAIDFPELLAGVSPATGAAIQTTGDEDFSSMAQVGMPMMMVYGSYDAEQRWPITHDPVELGPVSTVQTLEERIDSVNKWNQSCGAASGLETVDSVQAMADSKEENASKLFGLSFDNQDQTEYETTYSYGDLYDENGDPIVRYMYIDQCPHFVTEHWAENVYDYFSQFSRNQDTKKIEYQAK